MTDISGPLSQFQHRRFVEGDVKKLFSDINNRLPEPLDDKRFNKLFGKFWPDIYGEYSEALKVLSRPSLTKKEKTDRQILDELLFRIRSLERNISKQKITYNLSKEEIIQLPVTVNTLAAYSKTRFSDLPISEIWQDQLLSDINPEKYQYIRDLDEALTKAMPALEFYSKERSDLFRHSTDYLTKALGFVDREFREIHSFGLDTMEAFQRLGDKVKSS